MAGLDMEYAENEGGLQQLREECEKNPHGEGGVLAKAESSGRSGERGDNWTWTENGWKEKEKGDHPQYHLPENWVPMGKGVKGRPKRDDVVILQDRYRD